MSTEQDPILESLFSSGILVDLHIGKPTFQKKLSPDDLLKEAKDIDTSAIYLGHKNLLPKKALAALANTERWARTTLACRSITFPLSDARFVSYKALPELLTKLKEIKNRWNEEVKFLIDNFATFKTEQLLILGEQDLRTVQERMNLISIKEDRVKAREELNKWFSKKQEENKLLYPSTDSLPSLFKFSWRMFKVTSASGLDEMSQLQQEELVEARNTLHKDMQNWLKITTTAMHQALGEAAIKAKGLLEKQGRINARNLRPLFEAFETFSALDFTAQSNWRKPIVSTNDRFIKRDEVGEIDYEKTAEAINSSNYATTGFKELIASIGNLAIQQVAEEAGLIALSRVENFKRAIEV